MRNFTFAKDFYKIKFPVVGIASYYTLRFNDLSNPSKYPQKQVPSKRPDDKIFILTSHVCVVIQANLPRDRAN